MNVAVVGTGRWGINLVRNFKELGVLAAICEADEARGQRVPRQFGVPVFRDLSSLASTDIQAVAVATPPATHLDVASQLLRFGKHVFVEKPLTLTARDAETLEGLAAAQGRVLMVGHLLIYQPAIQWIRSFINDGNLGQVLSLHQERLGLGRARSVENALWSLGVHDVAALLYLTGQFPNGVGATGRAAIQPEIEDDVYLHLSFNGGLSAHLHVSWLWPEKRRVLTVVGRDGMLVYDELAQTVTLHRKTIDDALANVDHGSEVVFQGDSEPLKLELQHFLECARDGKQPLTDAHSGVDVVRVLEQAGAQLSAFRVNAGKGTSPMGTVKSIG